MHSGKTYEINSKNYVTYFDIIKVDFKKKNALLVSTIDNISIHKIFLFKSLFSLRFLLLFQAYITKQVFETWLKIERIASLKL